MYKHVLLKEPGTDRILIVESSGTLKERRVKNYLKAGWEQVGQVESPMHDFELTAGLTSEFRARPEKSSRTSFRRTLPCVSPWGKYLIRRWSNEHRDNMSADLGGHYDNRDGLS